MKLDLILYLVVNSVIDIVVTEELLHRCWTSLKWGIVKLNQSSPLNKLRTQMKLECICVLAHPVNIDYDVKCKEPSSVHVSSRYEHNNLVLHDIAMSLWYVCLSWCMLIRHCDVVIRLCTKVGLLLKINMKKKGSDLFKWCQLNLCSYLFCRYRHYNKIIFQ